MSAPYGEQPINDEELPSPWRRRLEKTAQQAYAIGLWRGFKVGIWFSVGLWLLTAFAYYVYLKVNS